jgi:hypothetical protein
MLAQMADPFMRQGILRPGEDRESEIAWRRPQDDNVAVLSAYRPDGSFRNRTTSSTGTGGLKRKP